MSRVRFFLPKENKKNNTIFINNDENIHLNSVLRLKVGDLVEICINDGCVYNCELIEVGKKQSIGLIKDVYKVQTRLNKLVLFLALTKSERMDWAVQKCTELGIDKIVPFESSFCTVKDKGNKTDRLNRVAISACKQSGRVLLPEINSCLTFDEMLNQLENYSQIILAYENDKTNAKDIISSLDKTKDVAIVIGSEGGFSELEVNKIISKGGKVVSLGENILRAETACIALLSAINYEFDFWKRK